MDSDIVIPKLTIIATIITGIVLSIYLGVRISDGRPTDIITILPIILLFVHALFFIRWTLIFALILAFWDLKMRPFGFEISAAEQICVLLGVYVFLTWWRKLEGKRLEFSELFSFKVARAFVGIYFIYVILHALINTLNPVSPLDYDPKNAAKTYLFTCFGFMFILWFFLRPGGLKKLTNISKWVGIILLICVLINWGIAIYRVQTTGFADSSFAGGVLYIPIIRATENIYVLRTLAPIAACLGAVYATSQAKKVPKFLGYALIAVGTLSTLWSGGRAALIFAMFLSSVVFIYRKKYLPIIMVAVYGAVGVLVVNTIDQTAISKMPFIIQRSLAYVLFTSKTEAEAQIEGSSVDRERWFKLGMKEWRSSTRVIWFGRSAYSFRESDIVGLLNKDQTAYDIAAVRRVATHNLVSDLLIMYGAIGATLYYLCCFSLILWLYNWHRQSSPDSEASDWTLVSMLILCFYVVYASIGGTWFWNIIPLFIVVSMQAARSDAEIKEAKPVAAHA